MCEDWRTAAHSANRAETVCHYRARESEVTASLQKNLPATLVSRNPGLPHLVCSNQCGALAADKSGGSRMCEGGDDVVAVKAPLGGVAQVIFHGVQVVEVGVQVRVHQDRGVEEDGEGQVEVEREVDEDQGETLIMACG